MARFNFRHGIARRQEDGTGNPAFLQPSNGGSYIDLIVSPDPTVFIAAHYDADYMITENVSVVKAWGPFVTGTDYYLYWDVDFITGQLTRGFTVYEPVDSISAPSSPIPDQHWFDSDDKVMKVWSGSSWVEKIRVFAASYTNGAVLTYFPKDSQVGFNNVRTYAGTPLFDPDGNPLQKFQRNRRGQFITTETDLHSQFARISNFRVEAAVVQAEANEEIPIHYCVAYFNFDRLILGRSSVTDYPVIGISMEEMNTNEVRSFITKGYVTNEIDWDWSGQTVGTPLFCGETGELTLTAPSSGMIQQVATIVNTTTIFVDIKTAVIFGPPSGGSISIAYDLVTGRHHGVPPGQAHAINDHTDVTISSPVAGQTLIYDDLNGDWINSSAGGGGGTESIGWIPNGVENEFRLSDTFTEGGTTYGIRAVDFDLNDKLRIELASFDPVVTVDDQLLFWDQAVTQFTVGVVNPVDYPSRWIDEVFSITSSIGVHTILTDYNAAPQFPTAAGGVDWTQAFGTNLVAHIYANTSDLTGGNASATITFADDQGAPWTDIDVLNVAWQSANATITFGNLSGNNFLESYTSVPYTVSITGIQSPGSAVSVVTPVGGSVTNVNASGTFIFSTDLHKNNNVGRSVGISTNFTRPASVTGTEYTVNDTDSDLTISASFDYPSAYVWMNDTITPPTRSDYVVGNDFNPSAVVVGNTNQIDQIINNPALFPAGFWFAVRSSSTQPTSFQTGPSSSLLSDVTVVTGNVVDLEPDSPGVGYVAEEYTLYGITLQPGNTYVRIL